MISRSIVLRSCLVFLMASMMVCVVYSQTTAAPPTATQPATRRGGAGRGRGNNGPPMDWTTTRPDGPVEPGAKLQRLGNGYMFTEGSTSDDQGNVFFIDQPNDRIMKWSTDGVITTFMQPSGHSNGMSFDYSNNPFGVKGSLISCADEKNELWQITMDKKTTVLVKDYQGKLLNGPNDVWIRPDTGGMYLTDPLYARNWWSGFRTAQMQQPGKYVYYLSPDRKTLTPVITDLDTPNGIIGTPDGKMLYVGDLSRNGKTWSYTINPDGSLTDKKAFCNMGSDGMTIDSDGNIYLTGGGALTMFDKNGQQIERIAPFQTANVCFGGKDGHMLFICAGTEVYGLKMRTSRVGPQ